MQYLPYPIVIGTLIFSLAGCRPDATPGSGTEAPNKLNIAVIPKSTGAEFWETVEEGARSAAAKFGVAMKWEGTLTETEIAEQNKIVENMVNLGVDGIALAPLNRIATRKTVENAVAAGIPVVIFDSSVDGDAHVSFVATNNKQGGMLGGQHLIKLLDGHGSVMCMRFVQGTGSTEARAEGFIETVQAAGLNLAADPYPEDGTVAGAKKAAANTLEGFIKNNSLELDGIFACNDRATLGMLAALEDISKSGIEVHAKFVGFDFTPRLVDSLSEALIDALVVQNPRKMGYLAVETLVEHLRGQPVPSFIDTGVELVTRKLLEQDASIRKLVGADQR